MGAAERVEREAILAAVTYASINGAPRVVGAGLVLAGMVIASMTTFEAQQRLRQGYLAQHPDARDPMERWARLLAMAAES